MLPDRDQLALRQQALINKIRRFHSATNNAELDSDNKPAASVELLQGQTEGLRIYQNNLKASAYRALSITYPVLGQLVGDRTLRLLAQQLIQEKPLSSGDWGDWGEELATLIAASNMVDDYPFLADVAILEWNLHCVNRSKNNHFDRASLALLEQYPLDSVHIKLSHSTRRVSSRYPIDTLWKLHQTQDNDQQQTLTEQLQQEFSQPASQFEFLITTKDYRPHIDRLSTQDALWLSSVLSGSSLDTLLTEFPIFNFSDWLKSAIENDYLTGFFTRQNSL
ncbi:MAG: DNA-binding domain-containing protein [Cellvibrionaceae bacterium]